MAKFTIHLPYGNDKRVTCVFEQGRDGKYRASNESLLALGIKSLTYEGTDTRTKAVDRLLLKATHDLSVEEVDGSVSAESGTAHEVVSRSAKPASVRLTAARAVAEELSTNLIGVMGSKFLYKAAYLDADKELDNPVARIRRKLDASKDGMSGNAELMPYP